VRSILAATEMGSPRETSVAVTAPHFALGQAHDDAEARHGMAINMLPLGREWWSCVGNPVTRSALEAYGVTCLEVEAGELMKGSGSVHCMTGVIHGFKELA
jgi:N-dimethylarginine dimethylaminohydrolase